MWTVYPKIRYFPSIKFDQYERKHLELIRGLRRTFTLKQIISFLLKKTFHAVLAQSSNILNVHSLSARCHWRNLFIKLYRMKWFFFPQFQCHCSLLYKEKIFNVFMNGKLQSCIKLICTLVYGWRNKENCE